MDYQKIDFNRTTPNWKMGTSSKDYKIGNSNPGPGDYDIPSKIGEGPNYIIKNSNNGNKFAHDSQIFSGNKNKPDPFSYDPKFNNKFKNVAYSIGNKFKDINYNINPGPGAYNKLIKSSTAPSYSMTKGPKNSIFSKTTDFPSPFAYNLDNFANKSSIKSYRFGSDKKLKDIRSITPGAGYYEHKEIFGKEGKKVSLRGKPKSRESNNLLCPGYYNPSIKIIKPNNSNGFKYHKGEKYLLLKNSNPSPADYTPEKNCVSNFKNIPKWSMGNKSLSTSLYGRLEKIHGNKPAPGDYNLNNSIIEGPKYSMGIRKNFNYDNKVPGPGRYNHTDVNNKDNSPSWKFGTTRKNFFEKKQNSDLGPCDYSPELVKSGSSIKFSKDAKMKPTKNNLPGPGHYHIPCSIVDVPNYVLPNTDFKKEYRYI